MQLWDIRERQPEAAQQLTRSGIAPLAAAVLSARGLNASDAAALIGAGALCDPLLMKDIDVAAQTVAAAVERGTMICVFGDYDCDGVAATAMTASYLEQIGGRVCYYIPHREREGYGLNVAAIDELARLGVGLIVTVDNGVSAIDEVAHANAIGIQVVVTDHHKPRERLPEAAAVVNPHRSDCGYPFKGLAGVGVAFKLLCALEGERGHGLLEQYADLLAIGTVADVVPLVEENRCFVRRGLELLRDSERPGLRALMAVTGFDATAPTAESIAFGLAPRINAAGRIDTAELAAMLLLTESEREAAELAQQLEALNLKRRELEKAVMEDIAAQLDRDPSMALRRVMVAAGEGWHPGVVGIVCARMVERFERPAVLIAVEGGEAKGSGRSVEGFSLIDAVQAGAEALTRYGGHPMAAGFSLERGRVGTFGDLLEQYAASSAPDMPFLRLRVDCAVAPSELSVERVRGLACLEPFGAGNEPPVFAVRGARLDRLIPLSQGKHVKLRLIKDNQAIQAMAFFTRPEELGFFPGDLVDVAVTAGLNAYQGEVSVSLKLKGIRLSGVDQRGLCDGRRRYERYLRGELLESGLLPSREETAALYRYLRRAGGFPDAPDALYSHLALDGPVDYARFRIALDVLIELGVVRRENGGRLTVDTAAPKVRLETSAIVRSLSNA